MCTLSSILQLDVNTFVGHMLWSNVGMTLITVLSKYCVSSCVILKISIHLVLLLCFHILNSIQVLASFLLLLNLWTLLANMLIIFMSYPYGWVCFFLSCPIHCFNKEWHFTIFRFFNHNMFWISFIELLFLIRNTRCKQIKLTVVVFEN